MINFFPQLQQVKDIDLKQLKEMSRDLAKTVQQSGYIPEHILYVERAGLLIGFEMAVFFQCGISGIHSKRSGGTVKSKLKNVFRYLPRFVTHFLRRLELRSNIHEVKKERNVYCEYQLPPENKKILIVDDAIDTGHSLVAVEKFLEDRGYSKKQIQIAALTTTGLNAAVKADFCLLDQITCAFPWSSDSRQYEETQGVYSTEKYVINHFPLFKGPQGSTRPDN
jgi:hypoxanthine phosphoribosyltransferase